jgi:hypothetical protein
MSEDTLSMICEQADLLHEDNAIRVMNLEAKTNNPGSLENAFDALKMLTYLEHIALELEIADKCRLDFEGRRADMLTTIELKVEEMRVARATAERQARLAGGPIGIRGGQPMRPGPGGIVRRS